MIVAKSIVSVKAEFPPPGSLLPRTGGTGNGGSEPNGLEPIDSEGFFFWGRHGIITVNFE
jgi:hypothetical protein